MLTPPAGPIIFYSRRGMRAIYSRDPSGTAWGDEIFVDVPGAQWYAVVAGQPAILNESGSTLYYHRLNTLADAQINWIAVEP